MESNHARRRAAGQLVGRDSGGPDQGHLGRDETATATVEAIEASTRQVTVKKAGATNETFYVPTSVKRFDQLKVGDKITVRYYENVVPQLKQPGSPDADDSSGKLVPVEDAPAGTMSYQRTITATITAMDPSVPSIPIQRPEGMEVQQQGAGQGHPGHGQGRRQGRHHLDLRRPDVDRVAPGHAVSRNARRMR